MKFFNFLRRAKSSFRLWSAPEQVKTEAAAPAFRMDEVADRVAKLKAPEPKEPSRFHSLVKLAPIPVPREVRWESQAINLGAWACTLALAWGGFQVPVDWLLWYGAAGVLIFAALFRLEGPRTRDERLHRAAEVRRCHEAYQQAEARLKVVLSEGFNERMEAFTTLRAAYEEVTRALRAADTPGNNRLIAALSHSPDAEKSVEEELMEQMMQMERQMLKLVDEMEDYSDTHKVVIDEAIMARHNARLAYWQARLDEAALTGEAVQQH